ncbi:MAG: hypothetical protein ACOYME_13805 [Prochlorotrichaceae cyanobacterium]
MNYKTEMLPNPSLLPPFARGCNDSDDMGAVYSNLKRSLRY